MERLEPIGHGRSQAAASQAGIAVENALEVGAGYPGE